MSTRPRQVVIVVYDGVQSLDVTGPLEVFHTAQLLIERTGRRDRGYEVSVVSSDGGPLQTSSGLTIVPDRSLRDAASPIDTLIVAGGSGRSRAADSQLVEWLRGAGPVARRTASVCTGTFLLAAAGLLDGRRVTTHWAHARELAERYPAVEVDPQPIFITTGHIWTSAGVTAGMDMALAMVERDLDRDAALTIARHLVLFLRRPGSQSQFSATLAAQQPRRQPLRELQRYAIEHPGADLSIEAMAARVHVSPRHLGRVFRAETGVTPARFVERVRLEAARRRLEDVSEPVAEIARACGFGTPETMRRAFVRGLGVAPAEYRRRFCSTHPATAA